jgi:hypothetical protein
MKQDFKKIIEEAIYFCEGGWQNEELRRRNSEYIATKVLEALQKAQALKNT